MILTCPECTTRYHVDPATFGPEGRRVRCAHCGHRWLGKAPADTPRVVEVGPPASAAEARRRAVPEAEGRKGSAGIVGWLVGLLLVLVLASAIVGRNEIVADFPTSASIYQALRLPVTLQPGLQFENVTSQRLAEHGVSVLVVEGEIVNVSGQERKVPPVRIKLLDEDGRELQEDLFEPAAEALAAGGKTDFSGRMLNPAKQARNFSVSFEPDR